MPFFRTRYENDKGESLMAAHESEDCLNSIIKIIKDFDPEIMIELGTWHGGMTLVFHNIDKSIPLHTFDIDIKVGPHTEKKYFNKNVIWYDKADLVPKPYPPLVELLQGPEKKFLYMDNGDKDVEFRVYAPFVNVGDLIGVHDWNLEVFPEDVEDVVVDFEPERHKLFKKNDWSSRFWIRRRDTIEKMEVELDEDGPGDVSEKK